MQDFEIKSLKEKLAISLTLLRLSIFLVMLMWSLDKLINPNHATMIFKNFYALPDMSSQVLSLIASLQLAVVFAFVIGFKKKYTYGLILLMHSVSTFSSYKQYLNPWKSLLFFAAWPMLAACISLFLLRDFDTLWVLKEPKSKTD